jgi:hypothetical protein
MKQLIIAITLLASASVAYAEDLGMPIENAAKAYLEKGPEAFIPALLKGSPLEGEKSAYTQSAEIRKIEAYYGKFLGVELMREQKLSETTRLVYYIMNFEKSPVFGDAILYKIKDKEIVTSFNFNTELWSIVPREVVFQ